MGQGLGEPTASGAVRRRQECPVGESDPVYSDFLCFMDISNNAIRLCLKEAATPLYLRLGMHIAFIQKQ